MDPISWITKCECSLTAVCGVAIVIPVVWAVWDLVYGIISGRNAYSGKNPNPFQKSGVKALAKLIYGEEMASYREKAVKELSSAVYHTGLNPGDKLATYREVAFKRLKSVAKAKLIEVKNLDDNPDKFFTCHELMAAVDASTATKMTVQFNLFGGSVLRLGNKDHLKILTKIDKVDESGCFALTELGWGNNAVNMKTEAVYDAEREEFVINTPCHEAQKFWITNGAEHAQWSVVFAQLRVKDEEQGVHGFLVRIRNDDMTPCKGVGIEDMGWKLECNGVDNARLRFDKVRVPRSALLDKHSQVAKDGTFTSSIRSRRGRFLTVADQLLSGRVCLGSFALGGSKLCCAIAMKYSSTRLQFGPPGGDDVPILDYLTQQRALIGGLATLTAFDCGMGYCKEMYAKRNSMDYQEVVRTICVMKALCGWYAVEIANTARERCGGQGYLTVNKISNLIGASHACVSAEGDNLVLMQKVAKELLDAFVKQNPVSTVVSMVTGRVSATVTPPCFTSISYLQMLFRERERRLLVTLAMNMFGKKGAALFHTWNKNLNLVQTVARAFGERLALDAFANKIAKADATTKPVMTRLCLLYALRAIEINSAAFVSQGLVSASGLQSVESIVNGLCFQLREEAMNVIDMWGLTDAFLGNAPIAGDWVTPNSKYTGK
eukprot:GFYU01006505.1.p1 GENE.GFYU01006505.1~~GFYU01006505.1.p1  ORF type:complete len:662 (+),score=233.84 GFYU01006505.1:124-2109(+)